MTISSIPADTAHIKLTSETLVMRWQGMRPYVDCWQAMQQFTNARNEHTPDELWLLEHPPIFTQGQNGQPEHLLDARSIPVIKTDRGGQITYHGPGQLMVYTLIDIKRKKLNTRSFVTLIERSVIDYLASLCIHAQAKIKAPGVYVDEQKICSIGLRIRKGSAYHGIAFNVNMDLTPFAQINPCGFQGLKMTQLTNCISLQGKANMLEVGKSLASFLAKHLAYSQKSWIDEAYQNCQTPLL